MPHGPTRRQFLVGLAVFGAAGCRADNTSAPQATPSPSLTPDPDVAIVMTALSRTDRLINAYAEALASSPESSARLARLAAFMAEHVRHRGALLEWWPPDADYSGVPEGDDESPTPSATPSSPSGPVDLGALQAMESAASKQRADLALTASPLLARVLASISAADAVHAALVDAA